MHPPPIISFIIATYNCEKTLPKCLESIINQTSSSYELIIIDGGSQDGTRGLLEKNKQHIAYWISEPDRGIAHAWNKGIKHANGEWICFLGADDRLHNLDVVKNFAPALVKASEEGSLIVYGKVELQTESGQSLGQRGKPWPEAKKRFFSDNRHMHHQGVFQHRDTYQKYGLYSEEFGTIVFDYEFLIRVLKENTPVFLDHFVTQATAGGVSWSVNLALKSCLINMKARHLNGIYSISFPFVAQITKALIITIMAILLGEERTSQAILAYKKFTTRRTDKQES